MEKLFFTRKIQLKIDSEDPDYKSHVFKTLYDWRYICFKASNLIFTHHFVQHQIKEIIYLTDEAKVKLVNVKLDENGILATSRMNTTYQILARNFKGSIPMHIMSSLNSTLVSTFNTNLVSYITGEKTLPNFKKDLPIPFKGTDLKLLIAAEGGHIFHFKLFDIQFKTYLGKDFSDKKNLLHRLVKKEIKLCTSSLVLEKGKIFMLAVFESENPVHLLNENIVAEASLSLDYPITLTIGKARYTIGNKDEFLYKRLSIQAAIQRKQNAMSFMNSQTKKRLKENTIENLQNAEKRYVNQKQHVYSKRLIDLCVKNQAATLLLVDQQEKEAQASQDSFLFRNWGYGGLKQKIERKAAGAGITVIVE
ncbi:hypothetical protein ACFP1I_16515 [Dyadobacter subterraneus]|uniref:Transposase n=1 Tax=Dyadobacter subterraneus TaxID=2773304 RepID=A0ABR9WIV7_9BACT|nr:hypothetical protein [Dyadobacter subterraneus]MBE9465039.1 hypothetical protein [Dyadobacter subterraneus]